MGFCGSPERPFLSELLKTLIRKMSLKNALVKQILQLLRITGDLRCHSAHYDATVMGPALVEIMVCGLFAAKSSYEPVPSHC